MQNRIRCRVFIGESMYDVTNDMKNWDDIYSKLKRVDYGGVMRSFAGKFEFVRKGRDVIRKDLLENMLYSSPVLVWYERDESWIWNEVFRYVLDISSYDDDGNTLSINAIDNSIESIIKSKKGTQYEYLVHTIKEEKQLYYDRILLQYYADYIFGGTTLDDGTQYIEIYKAGAEPRSYSLPIEIYGSEIPPKESAIGADSVSLSRDIPHFAKSFETTNVSIDIEFDFYGSSGDIYIALSEIKEDASFIKHGEWYNQYGLTGKHTVENKTISFAINKGSILKLSIVELAGDVGGSGNATTKVYFTKFRMKVKWDSKASPVSIDAVSSIRLLNNLLQSMNGGNEGIKGEIVFGKENRLDRTLILAAESVRGLSDAKLYSSFTKFCNWMSAVFGFVYEVDGDIIRFIHRDTLYVNEVIKDLGGDINEFSCKVEPSLIYSGVRVGYDKQDYDSINGRDEFRFTTEYSSETTLTDNKLELISPYRADVYGIEFLAQKRGKDTTDNSSDNAVFFVGVMVNKENNRYELDRTMKIDGVLSPGTMFNVMYSPRKMLLANKAFIGISIDKLEYTSSDGNSGIVIDGISEKDQIIISRDEALFMPISVQCETCEQGLSDNKKGLISVQYDGSVYRGFIMDVENYHGKSKSNNYSLMVSNISIAE